MFAYPNFELKFAEGLLVWEGQTTEYPASVDAPPLRFRVEYPNGFPVAAIRVFPISPALPPEEWGHEWHRWEDEYVQTVAPDLRFAFWLPIKLIQVWLQRYWTNTLSFFLECCQKTVPTQSLNQKLHTCFHARLAFAVAIEESQRRNVDLALKNRYEEILPSIQFTLPRLLKAPEFHQTIAKLRQEGWLDWHILTAISGATMNERLNRKYAHVNDPEKI